MNIALGAFEIEKRKRGSRGFGFSRNVLIALIAASLAGVLAFQALEPFMVIQDEAPAAEIQPDLFSDNNAEPVLAAGTNETGMVE